jgi:hypothetical protein
VSFPSWSGGGEFSTVVRFKAPATLPPYSSAVLWEMGDSPFDARLQLQTQGVAGAATVVFSFGQYQTVGGSVVAGQSAAASVTCAGASQCTVSVVGQ